MANPWFRLYAEFEDDPKVQMLSEPMQRRLVMLFCQQCKEQRRTEAQIAFKWGIPLAEVKETKRVLVEAGFIDERWNLINWNRRQFLSDSSTERVRRHRERSETLLKRDETDKKNTPLHRNGEEAGNSPAVSGLEQDETLHNVSDVTSASVSVSVYESKGESEGKIDASMAVSGLIDTIQLHTFGVRVVLDRIAQRAEKDGEDMKRWVDAMAKTWTAYQEARPKLDKPWGAEKFFGEGHYRNPAGWPWRNGQGGKKLKVVSE